jgi:hypothetical protein
MADDFDRFIASALAPPERAPDRQFVARVQAVVALEGRLAAQRRLLLPELLKQLAALSAVAAALWWIARAAPVASRFAESPALLLAILLAAFGLLVALFSSRPAAAIRH